jgi:hypothetical protein
MMTIIRQYCGPSMTSEACLRRLPAVILKGKMICTIKAFRVVDVIRLPFFLWVKGAFLIDELVGPPIGSYPVVGMDLGMDLGWISN